MISIKEKLDDFLFYSFALFLLTISFSIAVGQLTLGLSLLIFIIIIFVNKQNPFDKELFPFWILIAVFILWQLLTSLLSPTPIRSLTFNRGEWLMTAIPIGIYLIKNNKYRTKLINIFIIGILLLSIYAIIQHYSGIYWFKKTPPIPAFNYGFRVKAFFAHRLTFGNYIATAFGFIGGYLIFKWPQLSKLNKIIFTTAFILSFIATFLSYSYGPILAVIIGLMAMALLYKRKYFIIMMVLIAVMISGFYLIVPTAGERISLRINKEIENTTGASRLYIWKNSLKIIADNPIIGVGQGNFIKEFEKQVPGQRAHVHAHNDPLNMAANSGLPGLIIYLLIWGYLFKHLIIGIRANNSQKPLFAAAFIGSLIFFTAALTEAVFADEEIRQLLMFVWAAGLGAKVISDNSGTNQTKMSKTS